jgi:hypothetical protein
MPLTESLPLRANLPSCTDPNYHPKLERRHLTAFVSALQPSTVIRRWFPSDEPISSLERMALGAAAVVGKWLLLDMRNAFPRTHRCVKKPHPAMRLRCIMRLQLRRTRRSRHLTSYQNLREGKDGRRRPDQ